MLSRADQIPLVPLIILSSFTVLRSFQLPKEPAHWFRQHPAISFFKESAVLVLERPTGVAPKSHRSFHELVGSLEYFPGQHHHGAEAAWFFKRRTPDCLSWVLSSSAPVRPSKCLRGFWGSRGQWLPDNWPTLSTSRVFFWPSSRFTLAGTYASSFEETSTHEVCASAFQSFVTNWSPFRRAHPPVPFHHTKAVFWLGKHFVRLWLRRFDPCDETVLSRLFNADSRPAGSSPGLIRTGRPCDLAPMDSGLRPHDRFPGPYPLMRFRKEPLRTQLRRSRVLTCRRLLLVDFHERSIGRL